MTKEIVIICHNYFPEETSTGLYTTQMAEFLARCSWEVTMITGFPHYPKWEINESYLDKEPFFEEEINGVRVMRYKHYVPKEPSFSKRIRQLTDFSFGSYFNLKKIERADVVFSVIPFTSSAWLGKLFSRRFRARHWIHIQDFEFNAAWESGMIGQNIAGQGLFKALDKIERNILDSADVVSTISKGMLAKLEDRTSTGSFFFPNWLDPDFIDPTAASVHPILSEDHFQVLYSGNIGEKQDWKAFVNLVTEFADDKGIEFVVVGDGASRKALEKKINHLRNVRFCDPVPQSQLNDLLCSADLHILFQKDNVIDTVMPSKLLGMMASEVPCLVSGHPKSEVSEIFKKHECGIYLESSDLKSTVSIIKELMAFGPQNQAMGKNARKFVIDSFSSEKVLERFRIKLDSIYES